MAKGTLMVRASVLASRVLPVPVPPMSRTLLLSISTSISSLSAFDQSLVMVVHGDRERSLGLILADHVVIEKFLDLSRGRNLLEELPLRRNATFLLFEDVLAEIGALTADVDIAGAFHHRADLTGGLATE